MAFFFIITFLLIVGCIIGLVVTIRDGEYGSAVFCGIFTFFACVLFYILIDVACEGNKRVVERSFPAGHYKLEVVVTESKTVVNDSTTVTKTDTTYVITGVEQIFGGSENYDYEPYMLDEYNKPLKSTERKYVKNRNN